jgi:cellulose biosynthesis protein BcsQ
MARIVSLINLKGGVAKTTTTVALAETLAARFNKRTLVVDLDPGITLIRNQCIHDEPLNRHLVS